MNVNHLLPSCRYRGKELGNDRFECRSPHLHVPSHGVHVDDCRYRCPYVDFDRDTATANVQLAANPKDISIAVGILTAPRSTPTIHRTVHELRRAGFDQTLHVFAEPDADRPDDSKLLFHQNRQQLGLWDNWRSAAIYLLDNTDANFILMCEDDLLLCPAAAAGLQHAIATLPHDDWGYASLYTPRHNLRGCDWSTGWQAIDVGPQAWGALGYCYSRESLEAVINSARVMRHQSNLVDIVVSHAFQDLHRRCYFHIPSLAAHSGVGLSSLGHTMQPESLAVRFDYEFGGAERLSGREPKRERPASRQPQADVAVVISSHNYGHFLTDAIESVLAQTVRPAEIIIIDDASSDSTRDVAEQFAVAGVRYHRVDLRHPLKVREVGFRLTDSMAVCFLDADDYLPPTYLQTGLAMLNDNVGIVYSDLQLYGSENGTVRHEFDADRIHHQNSLHAGSITRRAAIESSAAFDCNPPLNGHEDWVFFRRIVANGWQVAKNSTAYAYRRHETNRSKTITSNQSACYFEQAALALEDVTLFVPLSGRQEFWPEFSTFLEQQTWPHDQTKLILKDTSGSAEFGRIVRRWLAESDYSDARYISQQVARSGLADEDRTEPDITRAVQIAMARIYGDLSRIASTEYVWTLEDDIIPPLDACRQLMRQFDSNVASVAAPYRSRYHDGYVVWNREGDILLGGSGTESVGGNGFGCNIIRRSVLHHTVIRHDGPTGDFDPNFYRWLRSFQNGSWTALVDWSSECRHLEVGGVAL